MLQTKLSRLNFCCSRQKLMAPLINPIRFNKKICKTIQTSSLIFNILPLGFYLSARKPLSTPRFTLAQIHLSNDFFEPAFASQGRQLDWWSDFLRCSKSGLPVSERIIFSLRTARARSSLFLVCVRSCRCASYALAARVMKFLMCRCRTHSGSAGWEREKEVETLNASEQRPR